MAANLILAAQIYCGIGGVVAALFLVFGIGRIDENARGVWVARPILAPGVILIWPLVLLRWLELERGERNPHARYQPPLSLQPWMALALALIIPTFIAGALVLRQDGPFEAPAELLEPPQ